MPTTINRRHLLQATAATALSHSRILGANDNIRTAYIGLGSRGSNALLPGSLLLKADIAAVCDVYAPHIDRALTLVHSESGARPDSYADYRQILDRSDIDAVFIATPDHWHAKMIADACEAGKDIYVEKPLARTTEECLTIPKVVAKHKRIVQVGLQQRSLKVYRDALAMISAGEIGPVLRCEMAWGNGGFTSQPGPVVDPPDGLDWDAWQGPAPRQPFRTLRRDRWRHFWDYGHGQITDFGVHLMDVARWFMNIKTPLTCFAGGYSSAGLDISECVPNVVEAVWNADKAVVTYSTRNEHMINRFWGRNSWIAVNRETITTGVIENRRKPTKTKEVRVYEPGYDYEKTRGFTIETAVHIKNFLDCVRTRQQPNSTVEEAGQSTIACILASQSVRSGRSHVWDGHKIDAS